MDRIDIHIDVPAVNYKELRSSDSKIESSAQIRERVIRARDIQLNRFAAAGERGYCNAQMGARQIRTIVSWALTASACWNGPCNNRD